MTEVSLLPISGAVIFIPQIITMLFLFPIIPQSIKLYYTYFFHTSNSFCSSYFSLKDCLMNGMQLVEICSPIA